MKIILLSVILFISYVNGKIYPIFFPANKNISSDFKLTYLIRSGWMAETANHVLLFDYVPYEGKNFDEFIQLEFNKAVRNKKNLFIFISHEHDDHFYPKLLEWSKKYENLEIILGWKYESFKPGIHQLNGREENTIKQIKVASHPATDAGSAFLVTVDGITIYHAGDHAQWSPGLKEEFIKEMEYIKMKVSKIDIAFVPVENRRRYVMGGAVAATKILNPEHVLPMHSKFEDYTIFTEKVHTALPSVRIHSPKTNKEVFTIIKQ